MSFIDRLRDKLKKKQTVQREKEKTMSFIDWLSTGIQNKQYVQLAYRRIDPSHVDGAGGAPTLQAAASYIQIILRETYIKMFRQGGKEYYPVLYSDIVFASGEKSLDVQRVAGPSDFIHKIDAQNLDRVILRNQQLLGPLPYDGGDVQLNLALCSVMERDLARQFLDLLGTISKAIGVPQLDIAISLAGQIKAGMDSLVGLSDVVLQVGLIDTLSTKEIQGSNSELAPGYRMVVAAAENNVPADQFWINRDGDLLFGPNQAAAAPYNQNSYFLFQIDSLADRSGDWLTTDVVRQGLTNIKSVYSNGVKSAISKDGLHSSLLLAFNLFKAELWTSSEFIETDRPRVADMVAERIKGMLASYNPDVAPFGGNEGPLIKAGTPLTMSIEEARQTSIDQVANF